MAWVMSEQVDRMADIIVENGANSFLSRYTRHMFSNFAMLALEWRKGRDEEATIYDVYSLIRYERLAWQAVREVCKRHGIVYHAPVYNDNGTIRRGGKIDESELLDEDFGWLVLVVEQYLNRNEPSTFIDQLNKDFIKHGVLIERRPGRPSDY